MQVRSEPRETTESGAFRVTVRPERLEFPFAVEADGNGIVLDVSAAVLSRVTRPAGRRIDDLLRGPATGGWAAFFAGDPDRSVEAALIADGGDVPLAGFWVPSERGRLFLGRPLVRGRDDLRHFELEELEGTASILDVFTTMDEAESLSRGTERALSALQVESRRLRGLVRNTGGFLIVTNRSNNIVLVGSGLLEALGKEKQEVLSKPLFDVIDSPEFREWANSRGGSGEYASDGDERFECTSALPGAGERMVDWIITAVRDREGARTGFVVSGADVTERMNRVATVERARDELNMILDTLPFGVILIDETRKIQWINLVGMEMAGELRREEIIGRSCSKWCCHAEKGCCPVYDQGKYFSNKEMWFYPLEGNAFPVLKSVAPVRIGGKEYLLEVFIDIADRKSMESELEQARRLESIGQLAAGIAHEINTPTQFLSDNIIFLSQVVKAMLDHLEDYADLVRRLEGPDWSPEDLEKNRRSLKNFDIAFYREEIPEALNHSRDGIRRISEIVQAMKEFSHPGQKQKVPTDIEHAVRTTATVARNRWKYVADLEIDVGEGLDEVPCNPGEFNQVILNLIVNAADAIASKIEGSTDEKGMIRVKARRDGDWVEIRIGDTGGGVPPEILGRIFEPFFTTKEVGKGTGQGLAIARSVIVDKHDGVIRCESEPGVGTTFIVRLPIREKKTTESPIV
ncbi:MAG: PAS domain-containing protein [Candidatus Eisenbacteria bacterium]|nr:PAS domain-containing protein [Candidatus Eisenbacteria bacterium]